MSLKFTTVLAPLWRWEWGILQGDAKRAERFVQQYLEWPDVILDENSLGHTWIKSGYPILIWVSTITDIPVLAHEVMHGVFGMLEARGLTPSPDSEESYTYTVEAMLRAILQAKWKRVPR